MGEISEACRRLPDGGFLVDDSATVRGESCDCGTPDCPHVAAVELALSEGRLIPRAVCGATKQTSNGFPLLCNRDPSHEPPHLDGVTGDVFETSTLEDLL